MSSSSPLGNEGVGMTPLFLEGKEGRRRKGSTLDGGGGDGSGRSRFEQTSESQTSGSD